MAPRTDRAHIAMKLREEYDVFEFGSTELYRCSLPETHRLWEVLQGSETVETLHAPSVKESCTIHSAMM